MAHITLTRQELYDRLWQTPASKLAPELGVTDVGLGKLCKRLNIPKPPIGYWRRKETGQHPARPKLPKATAGVPETAFFPGPQPQRTEPPQPRFELANERVIAQIKQEQDSNHQPIVVHETLQRPHPLVTQTKRAYVGAKPLHYGPLDSRSREPHLVLKIARESMTRTLCLVDALIKGLITRKFANKAGEISINGEQMELSVSEKFSRIDNPNYTAPDPSRFVFNRPSRWIYTPTGLLTLTVSSTEGVQRSFSDHKGQVIEAQLHEVIAAMLVMSEEVKFMRQRREAAEQAQREAAERRRIEEQRRRIEIARREILEQRAATWMRAEHLRAFVQACEQQLGANGVPVHPDSAEVRWLTWARGYADRIDPLQGGYLAAAIQELAHSDEPPRGYGDGLESLRA